MKTSILFPLRQLFAASLCAAALTLVSTGYAGLQIPYTPNADTLHLWHFDGATNTIPSTDAVVTASITLTNFAQPQVPGTAVTLGNPAAIAQLGTCLQIIPTNFSAGNAFGFAVNGTFQPDTNPFRNFTSGAFTIEAIIKCAGNPYLAGNGNWEIVAGDNSPGAGQSRGWQFRIQTGAQPQLNFNFITGGGGNYLANLPKGGPNIFLPGIWYHVAVTYTGNVPTNSDTAGVLTFYWTVLDGGKTAASVLTNYTQTTINTLGGTPVLGIGGSARNLGATVANGEGFKGYIDEVRFTGLCLGSNDMAFAVGGAATPVQFLVQPPTNTFVGYGKTLSLPALVTGGGTYYWYRDGTYLPSQTDSSLLIPAATFGDAGDYTLIASNSINMVTSSVPAHVTIGAAFSELFATGKDTNGALAGASVDAHYSLIRSDDAAHLGPSALVYDMNTYPIAQFGGNFSNPDGSSQWIGPTNNSPVTAYVSPVGQYTYRTTFLLDSVDLAQPVTLSGVWYVNELGNDILLNGVSTGKTNSAANSNAGKNPANFVLTNGFVPGLNTLDFVTTRSAAANGAYQESALRVDLSGLGQALAPGKPTINTQPANITVRENGRANFSVVALGRPPLSYQWYGNSTLLTDATNRNLLYDPVTTGGQPSSFQVVISNDSGSVTSNPVALTLTTNRPPIVPPPIHLVAYSNAPANVSIATILYGSSDPDNDYISFSAFDVSGTNGGSITQVGINLVYTSAPGLIGDDQFSYYIVDPIDFTQGFVTVTVYPMLSPTFSGSTIVGTNLVLNVQGGVAGGSYTLLSTTNLTLPLTNWTTVTAGTFDGSGQFSVTNAIRPGVPASFYLIRLP